ncbi:uncharacterized protein LOC143250692 isoform X1 [Tachypleus tridentatus]|uniref:uncharacterized protein LOC143250692 isoform X1 n=1 Tax=Tachypleus tridentatus TaxID=6853 RepID=UPI003FD1F488
MRLFCTSLVLCLFLHETYSRSIRDAPVEEKDEADEEGTCYYDGKWYQEGEELPTRKNCFLCHCRKGFIEPNSRECAIIDCPWGYYRQHYPGCTSVYSDNECCPVDWKCPDVSLEAIPKKRPDFCYKPPTEGEILCTAVINRFFYDAQTSECKPFIYGGCGTTGNTFNTLEECNQVCGVKAPENDSNSGTTPEDDEEIEEARSDSEGQEKNSCDCELRYFSHYETKGCSPVYDEEDGCKCPSRFECPAASEQQHSPEVCLYKGVTYQIGQDINTTDPCRYCTCRQGATAEDIAVINCISVECPHFFSPTPLKKGCYHVYEEGRCCPVRTECVDESNQQTPRATCDYNGKRYELGQTISPDEDECLTCLCTEEWNGINSTSCKRIECLLEEDLARLRRGCIPIYHESTCCPIDYHCPSDTSEGNVSVENVTDKIEIPDFCNLPNKTGPCLAYFRNYFYDPSEKQCKEFVYGGCQGNENNFRSLAACEMTCMPENRTAKQEDIDNLCYFNRKYYSKGELLEINHPTNCVKCTCDTPPDFTCIHQTCPPPPNNDYENCEHMYEEGTCCPKYVCRMADEKESTHEHIEEAEESNDDEVVMIGPPPEENPCTGMNCAKDEQCVMFQVKCIREPCPPLPTCIKVNPDCPTPSCAPNCVVSGFDEEHCPICDCKARSAPEHIEEAEESNDDEVVMIGPPPEENPCTGMNCEKDEQCVMFQVKCVRASCPPLPTCIKVNPDCPTPSCAPGCVVSDLDEEHCPTCVCRAPFAPARIEAERCPVPFCEGYDCVLENGEDGCKVCLCKVACETPICQQGCEVDNGTREGQCPSCVCKVFEVNVDKIAYDGEKDNNQEHTIHKDEESNHENISSKTEDKLHELSSNLEEPDEPNSNADGTEKEPNESSNNTDDDKEPDEPNGNITNEIANELHSNTGNAIEINTTSVQCPEPSCSGFNCKIVTRENGCSTCICQSACPPAECNNPGCKVEANPPPGKCPGCVCTVEDTETDDTEATEEKTEDNDDDSPATLKCPSPNCVGHKCTIITGDNGCPTCTCESNCPIPTCPPGCEVEPVTEGDQCPGCRCEAKPNPDTPEQ